MPRSLGIISEGGWRLGCVVETGVAMMLAVGAFCGEPEEEEKEEPGADAEHGADGNGEMRGR